MISYFIMVQQDLKNCSVKLFGPGALSSSIWARVSSTSWSVNASFGMRRFCGVKSSTSHLRSRVLVLGWENRSWKCCYKVCCFSSCDVVQHCMCGSTIAQQCTIYWVKKLFFFRYNHVYVMWTPLPLHQMIPQTTAQPNVTSDYFRSASATTTTFKNLVCIALLAVKRGEQLPITRHASSFPSPRMAGHAVATCTNGVRLCCMLGPASMQEAVPNLHVSLSPNLLAYWSVSLQLL